MNRLPTVERPHPFQVDDNNEKDESEMVLAQRKMLSEIKAHNCLRKMRVLCDVVNQTHRWMMACCQMNQRAREGEREKSALNSI